MAASLDKNDSSSEDEYEARYREAAVDSAQIFSKNDEGKPKAAYGEKRMRPSLRPDSMDVEDEDYLLDTTPGFRKHISRKLGEIIDSQIDEVNTDVNCSCTATESEGIKLLSGSTKFVQTDEDIKIPQRKRKKKISSSSSDSSDDEKLAEAAVSHDLIVKESRLLQNDTADFIYKAEGPVNSDAKTVHGKSVVKGHETVDNGILNNLSSKKHKKKKKKKKKEQDTEDKVTIKR